MVVPASVKPRRLYVDGDCDGDASGDLDSCTVIFVVVFVDASFCLAVFRRALGLCVLDSVRGSCTMCMLLLSVTPRESSSMAVFAVATLTRISCSIATFASMATTVAPLSYVRWSLAVSASRKAALIAASVAVVPSLGPPAVSASNKAQICFDSGDIASK